MHCTLRRLLVPGLLALLMGATAGCSLSLPRPDVLPGPSAPAGSRSPEGYGLAGSWVAGELLLGYEDDAALARIVQGLGGQVIDRISEIRAARVALPAGLSVPEAVARLTRGHPDGMRYAEPNYIRRLIRPGPDWPAPGETIAQDEDVEPSQIGRFNDPLQVRQWALDVMGTRAAWPALTGQGVIIGIVDTGMDGTHPDLRGKQLPGRDCLSQEIIAPDTDSSQKEYAHATHVAGIAAAHGGNGEGIVGVAPDARIMLVQIFNARLIARDNPSGYVGDANVAQCLLWASLIGPDGVRGSGDEATVLNNSWGGRGYGQTLKEAIDVALENGVVFVNSMGNSSEDEVLYPKGYPGVLAVGATTPNDKKVDFSTMGRQISVGAPGVDILSSVPLWLKRPDGEPYSYMYFSGTSMATPQVSGAIALLQERFPNAMPYQLKRILEQTADDIEQPGFDRRTGHGRINLARMAHVTTPPPDGARITVRVDTRNRGDLNGDGVIDEADGQIGVPYVDVILRSNDINEYFARTNAQGEAHFIGIDPGSYDVWVAGGDAMIYNYRPANRITKRAQVRVTSGETAELRVEFNTRLNVSISWSESVDVDLLVQEPRPGDDAEWVSAKVGAHWGRFSADSTGTGLGTHRETYTLSDVHYPFAPYTLALSAENASSTAEVRVVIEQNGHVEGYGPFRLRPGQVLPSNQWRGWWENTPRPDEGFAEPGPGAPWVY